MALRREASEPTTPATWIKQHAAGLTCAALGLVAIAVAAVLCFGGETTIRIPDVRVTAPLLVATCAAAVVALVRREGTYPLLLCGVTLAGAAMVLGWAVVVAVIALCAAIVIAVMHHVM